MSTQNEFYCPTCERDTHPAKIIETPTDAQRRGATFYDQAPWVLIDGSDKKKCVNRAMFDDFHANIPRWYCGLCLERGLMPVTVKSAVEQILHRYDRGRKCLSSITDHPMVAVIVAAAIFQKEGRRGGNVIRVIVPTADHSFWIRFISAFFLDDEKTDVQVISKEKNSDIAQLLKDMTDAAAEGDKKSIVVVNVEFLTGPIKHLVELSLLQYIRKKFPDVVLLHLGRTIDESTVLPFLGAMGIFDAIPQTMTHGYALRLPQEATIDTTKDTTTIINQIKSAYLPPPITGNKRTKKSTNIARLWKEISNAAFESGLIANNTSSYFDSTDADTDTLDGLKTSLVSSLFPKEGRRGIAEIFGSVSSNEPTRVSRRLVHEKIKVDHVVVRDEIPNVRESVLEYLKGKKDGDTFGNLDEDKKEEIQQILERIPIASTKVSTLRDAIRNHSGFSQYLMCDFYSNAIVGYLKKQIKEWEESPGASPVFVLPCSSKSSKVIHETLSKAFGDRLDCNISSQTNHFKVLERVKHTSDQKPQIILSNTLKASHTNPTRSWSSINNGNLHLLNLLPGTVEESRCEITSSSDPRDRHQITLVLFRTWDGVSCAEPHLLQPLATRLQGNIYIVDGKSTKKLKADSPVPSTVLCGLQEVDSCC